MDKSKQRQIALALRRIRRRTIGMTLETWHHDVIEFDASGAPVYAAVARLREGAVIGPAVVNEVIRHARRWLVTVMLKCEADDGTQYVESREVAGLDACKFNELTPFVKAAKADIYSSVNPAHIRAYGWIAEALD